MQAEIRQETDEEIRMVEWRRGKGEARRGEERRELRKFRCCRTLRERRGGSVNGWNRSAEHLSVANPLYLVQPTTAYDSQQDG
jgi:hypothetical protein